jgi:ribosome-binding factor A
MSRTRGGSQKQPSQRQLRVGEEVRHALVRILGRGELRDPELSETQITVTEVRMSPDLRNATVYVVPFGGDDAATLAATLRRAAAFLRGQLADEVALRVVPALRFEADRSFEQASRIEQLLHDPQVAQDVGTAPAGGDRRTDRRDDEDGA